MLTSRLGKLRHGGHWGSPCRTGAGARSNTWGCTIASVAGSKPSPCTTTARMASHRFYHVQVVSPGQILFKLPLAGAVRVGPGLQVEGDCLITTKSGILRKTKAGKFWVEGRSKRWR